MSDTFGKGTRVRVSEGDHEGAIGEVFWWGRSKFGPELRAGVLTEEGEEKIWVEAKEIIAIDEQGEDLDPQPRKTLEKKRRSEFEVRRVELDPEFARAITTIRLRRGIPESNAAETVVRMDQLADVEKRLGCKIPDAVLAYVAGGAGESAARHPEAVVGFTADLISNFDREDVSKAEELAFDDDNGNFLVFSRGAELDDVSIRLLDHEESFLEGPRMSILEYLAERVGELDPRTPPFSVRVDYLTKDAEPVEPVEIWVTHAKFGRGRVTDVEKSSKGDKLTIEFDDATRKLLERFVVYD